MIDYSHPVFSKQRCDLLKLIPAKQDYNWMNAFIDHLTQDNRSEALLLATYLDYSEKYNETYFQDILSKYKNSLIIKIKLDVGLQDVFIQLLDTRQGVLDNELSKNPLGQILEPGFRVIFPVSD